MRVSHGIVVSMTNSLPNEETEVLKTNLQTKTNYSLQYIISYKITLSLHTILDIVRFDIFAKSIGAPYWYRNDWTSYRDIFLMADPVWDSFDVKPRSHTHLFFAVQIGFICFFYNLNSIAVPFHIWLLKYFRVTAVIICALSVQLKVYVYYLWGRQDPRGPTMCGHEMISLKPFCLQISKFYDINLCTK